MMESTQRPASPEGQRRAGCLGAPRTKTGRWAAACAGLFLVLFIINASVLMQIRVHTAWQQALFPFYGIGMLLCGLAAGILAGLAVLREGERSWATWLAMLPALWVLFMLLGEVLVPH